MVGIGVMQGRLSPPEADRVQAFPAATWAEEFDRAREAGLSCIEWVYEFATEARNPLSDPERLAEVRVRATEAGVPVSSVCADCYMERPLLRGDGRPEADRVAHLRGLLDRCAELKVRHVVLPFVDASSLTGAAQCQGLVGLLRRLRARMEATGVELHLETDLAPDRLREVLEAVEHPLVCANYDIGNSAALGRDPAEELAQYGRYLGSVHVKDRVRGGGSVALGAGDADLAAAFDAIARTGYARPFILQAARGEPGREVALASANRRLVERLWTTAAARAERGGDGP